MEALLEKEGDVENWNDDRLDELSGRMDEGFKQINSDMKEGFRKMEGRFEKVDQRFEKVDERFEKVDERFEKVDERFEKVARRFENVATLKSVAEINTRLDRFEGRMDERMDRLYLAFVALVLMLGGNLIAGHVWG